MYDSPIFKFPYIFSSVITVNSLNTKLLRTDNTIGIFRNRVSEDFYKRMIYVPSWSIVSML